jgi:hypothetical protein
MPTPHPATLTERPDGGLDDQALGHIGIVTTDNPNEVVLLDIGSVDVHSAHGGPTMSIRTMR